MYIFSVYCHVGKKPKSKNDEAEPTTRIIMTIIIIIIITTTMMMMMMMMTTTMITRDQGCSIKAVFTDTVK